jgi:hypothetical protein
MLVPETVNTDKIEISSDVIMVNSETPHNVRATVPVDRSSFKKKFKCLKGKTKLPTWNLIKNRNPSCPCLMPLSVDCAFVSTENFHQFS